MQSVMSAHTGRRVTSEALLKFMVTRRCEIQTGVDSATAGRGAAEVKRRIVYHSAGRAYDELRELADGLHPGILSTSGLAPALKGIALRSPIPVVLDFQTHDRLPQRIEVTGYDVVSEALANVAKHSQASAVRVTVTVNRRRRPAVNR